MNNPASKGWIKLDHIQEAELTRRIAETIASKLHNKYRQEATLSGDLIESYRSG